MALIACVECGKSISDKAEFCPNCGFKSAAENELIVDYIGYSESKKNHKSFIIAILIVLIITGSYFTINNTIFFDSEIEKAPFPTADIFYDKAIASLSNNEYEESLALLDSIDLIYPNSSISPDVNLLKVSIINKIDSIELSNKIYYQTFLKKFQKFEDYNKGVIIYKYKKLLENINNHSNMHLYLDASIDKKPELRIVVSYIDNTWLGVERFVISSDDKKHIISPDFKSNIEKDSLNGKVYEWIDLSAGYNDVLFVQNITDSQKVTVRFEGKEFYKDIVLGNLDKEAIKYTLELYQGFIDQAF